MYQVKKMPLCHPGVSASWGRPRPARVQDWTRNRAAESQNATKMGPKTFRDQGVGLVWVNQWIEMTELPDRSKTGPRKPGRGIEPRLTRPGWRN